MPVTVIGAMNGEKPTWTLVAHVGIIGHDRILVSLASSHFINGMIRKDRKLSVSLVSEEMLPKVDVSGSVSGAREDKSEPVSYTHLPQRIGPSNCLAKTQVYAKPKGEVYGLTPARCWKVKGRG